MSARFADRVFIVSGAGSHTGRATAKRLAAEGARLVLVVGNRDRDPMSRPAATHNGTAALVTGDSAARATARDAVQTALTRFGRLDGVVTHDQATPEPATSAEALGLLDRMVHDSVRSTYLLAQEAAREMHSGGTVVCVTAPGGAQVEVGRVAHNVVLASGGSSGIGLAVVY